jgi:hypothetical protein
MKRNAVMLVGSLLALLPSLAPQAMAQERYTIPDERAEHPEIDRAIAHLQRAIQYMEHARGDFGGHKAEAIDATRRAIHELRRGLAREARHEMPRY